MRIVITLALAIAIACLATPAFAKPPAEPETDVSPYVVGTVSVPPKLPLPVVGGRVGALIHPRIGLELEIESLGLLNGIGAGTRVFLGLGKVAPYVGARGGVLVGGGDGVPIGGGALGLEIARTGRWGGIMELSYLWISDPQDPASFAMVTFGIIRRY